MEEEDLLNMFPEQGATQGEPPRPPEQAITERLHRSFSMEAEQAFGTESGEASQGSEDDEDPGNFSEQESPEDVLNPRTHSVQDQSVSTWTSGDQMLAGQASYGSRGHDPRSVTEQANPGGIVNDVRSPRVEAKPRRHEGRSPIGAGQAHRSTLLEELFPYLSPRGSGTRTHSSPQQVHDNGSGGVVTTPEDTATIFQKWREEETKAKAVTEKQLQQTLAAVANLTAELNKLQSETSKDSDTQSTKPPSVAIQTPTVPKTKKNTIPSAAMQNLPKYNGAENQWESFRNNIKIRCGVHNLDDEQEKKLIQLAVAEPALQRLVDWVMSGEMEKMNAAELWSKMEKAFGNPTTRSLDNQFRFRNEKMSLGDTVSEYAMRFRNNASRAGVSDEFTLVAQWQENMPEEYQFELRKGSASTIEDSIKITTGLQRACTMRDRPDLQVARRTNEQRTAEISEMSVLAEGIRDLHQTIAMITQGGGREERRNPPPGNRQGGIVCYNCNGQGHIARNCNEPRKAYCIYCRQAGHEMLTCKALKEAMAKTASGEKQQEPQHPK